MGIIDTTVLTELKTASTIFVPMNNYLLILSFLLCNLIWVSNSYWIGHYDGNPYDPEITAHKRYEMNERGFLGDSLSGGFGTFTTMKRGFPNKKNEIERKLDLILENLSQKNEN